MLLLHNVLIMREKKDKKIGEYNIEEYFINKLAPTTKKQEKLNADYLQC